MTNDFFIENEKSNSDPLEHLYSKEFAAGLNKAGSLFSMLENKKINITTMFSLLVENKNYQDFFVEVTASENFKHSILSLLYSHPSLVKSKITKSIIRKLHATTNNRTRKVSI